MTVEVHIDALVVERRRSDGTAELTAAVGRAVARELARRDVVLPATARPHAVATAIVETIDTESTS
jgi:hypothetical protein